MLHSYSASYANKIVRGDNSKDKRIHLKTKPVNAGLHLGS